MVRKRMSDAGKPKKPKAGQSFAEKCPEKAAQWDYECNDDTPYDVGSGSHDKRWFICFECGRSIERIICQFVKTKSVACQFCTGRWFKTGINDLLTKAPDVAAQLNDGADPSQIYYLSKDKHEFKCKHGHIVTTQVCLRVRHECKLCANEIIGRKSAETRIRQNGSLLDNRPDIVERYWDYDVNAENGIYPDKIGTGYRGNVVLHDDNGHRFVCRITEVIRGIRTKCTDCAMADERKRRRDEAIKKNGSFADNHPELISEINDGTDLTKIANYDGEPREWKCPKDARHVYSMSAAERASGNGCPICRGLRVIDGVNDFACMHSECMADFMESLNQGVDLHAVPCGSHVIITWHCHACGHEWIGMLKDRSAGHGCPECFNHCQHSYSEDEMADYIISLRPDLRDEINAGRGYVGIVPNRRLTADIYVPSMHVAVEYNGEYFHRNDMMKQYEKFVLFRDNCVRLYQFSHRQWKDYRFQCEGYLMRVFNVCVVINAESCVRVPVNANDAREFIIDNDINEFIPADEYYGLMWEGMLVAVAGINIINHIVVNYSVLHGYDIIDGMNALCPHVPVLIDDCTPCIHDANSDYMIPMLFPCLKSFDADNVMFDAGSSLLIHR